MTPRSRLMDPCFLAVLALAACGPTASEEAARNDSPRAVGTPPDNSFTSGNLIETNDPDIANTAEASRLETRADASATPQARVKGDVMGEGAPDTSGRAHQERKPEE